MRACAAAFVVVILVAGCDRGAGPPAPSTTTTTNTATTQLTTSTTDDGMAVGEQVPGEPLWALVAGNDLDADRINLVFAPWGWEDREAFEAVAAAQLSWDGDAFLIAEDGNVTADGVSAIGAQLGVFAIEPWRSSRDRFNAWVTDVEPDTPVTWVNQVDPPFDLPDQVVVVLALDAHRFNPELTSVTGFDVHFVGPGLVGRPVDDDPFANLTVVVDSRFTAAGLAEVPHELGHAMFNLPDEYVGQQLGFDGREDLSSWPSCAENQTEADAWWGDLLGDVDPMVQIWHEEMEQAGFPLGDPDALAEAVVVADVQQGCYGVEGSYRATFDSLMNNNIPVLGSVNRRWAEEILDLWEGAARP